MRKRFSDEQIVAILREAETGAKSIAGLCRAHGVSEPTFYVRRRKFDTAGVYVVDDGWAWHFVHVQNGEGFETDSQVGNVTNRWVTIGATCSVSTLPMIRANEICAIGIQALHHAGWKPANHHGWC